MYAQRTTTSRKKDTSIDRNSSIGQHDILKLQEPPDLPNKITLLKILKMKFSAAAALLTVPLALGFSTIAPSSRPETKLYAGVDRNPNFAKLAGGYLFPEIGRRRTKYIEENPEMADKIISLGIGDTTQPIPKHILNGLVTGASKLGTKEGYSGYGAENGQAALREKIATNLYNDLISPDEVFVSDGAKCDIMRLQQMFGAKVVSAVQDPSYPVYVGKSSAFTSKLRKPLELSC